jgi:anthranilate/para-aminobenzoate synthase component I
MYYCALGDVTVVGSSPEALVKLNAQRAQLRPIAGTRPRGDMDHAITIRTLVFSGDEYSYQAGAGIVADSVPEAEHEEVLAKSAAMVRALELAEAGL